ncbi:hypothetical protein Slin15195_G128050 [Septoria linicola]|uniref:Uncharacterized protein n=1 Tax=Septoria linicola TaxID=215465 RepID=A0A9Q9BAQ8_9PEZI|nr:hypothetical protein Slin15195_G128050 [Septoria linicola]
MVRHQAVRLTALLALGSRTVSAADDASTPWIWGLPIPNAGGGQNMMHSPPGQPIASGSVTADERLEPRQQEVITEACTPETAYIGHASCIPFVADQTSYICGTTTTLTIGCGVKNGTQSTTLAGPILSGRCAQIGCATCAADNTVAPAMSAVDYKNCTTVNGTIWGPPLTAFPSGTPPHGSGAPAAQITARDIEDIASDTLPRSILKLVTQTINIVKRTLMTPQDYPGGHDEFMMQQVAQADVAGMLVPHRPPGTDGRSSARVNGFRQVGFNIAVSGLNACTSIAIVSRKGAWLSHIWEIPTFQNDALFVEDVLYGIFEGDDSGYFPGINDHSHDASLFNTLTFGQTQNFVMPIIITPKTDANFWGDPSRPWRFMHDIQKVKDMLHNMFGVEPIVYAYDLMEKLSKEEVRQKLDNTAHGKVVVQYDPRQYLPVEPIRDSNGQIRGSCVKQYAAVRVYADVNLIPIWEDTWAAIPEQGTLPNNMQQVLVRDEASGNITGYGCMKEPPNSTCSFCAAGESCGVDPDDDQGQEGTPPQGETCSLCTSTAQCNVDPDDDQGQDGSLPQEVSCPVCTSMDQCGLNPDEDQGEDGPRQTSNGTEVCTATTLSAPRSSACTLTTMPAGTAPNGQPFAFGPTSCNCGGSLQPTTTTKGTDGTITPLCGADLPQTSCLCSNEGLVPLVTNTASGGDVMIGCDQGSTTVALSTSSKTPDISDCSTTVLAFIFTKCACPAGVTASLSTATGADHKETYFCAGPSGNGKVQPVGSASTSSPPHITECSLTRTANGTKPGFTPAITQYKSICACDHDRTFPATASAAEGGSTGWYCPTAKVGNTGSAIAVTTAPALTAPQTAAPPVTSCDLVTKPASSVAGVTKDGTTYASQSYPQHTVCSCNGLGEVAYNTVTAKDGSVNGECQLPPQGTKTTGFVVSTGAKPPPTSCSPFLATTPPGLGKSQSGWEPRTFCNCDHDRTLAWNEVTATNGDVVKGCGYGATDVVVPVATETATPSQSFSHLFLIYDVKKKASKGWRYWWSGLTMPISPDMNMCDAEANQWLLNQEKSEYRPFPYAKPYPNFPLEFGKFDLVGHKDCAYSGPSSNTPGNITCADAYTAYCTSADSGHGYDLETRCAKGVDDYRATVECRYHDTNVKVTGSQVAELKDPASHEEHVFEVFRVFLPGLTGPESITYWAGDVRHPSRRAACDKGHALWSSAGESYDDYYPDKLKFSTDGHGTCSYSSSNGHSIGSVTCDDGYEVDCAAFADDSVVDCDGPGTEPLPYYPLFYCRLGGKPMKTATTIATWTYSHEFAMYPTPEGPVRCETITITTMV